MVYGSMASGLALDGSDIDIAIRQLGIRSKEQLLDFLDMFSHTLQRQSFVSSCQVIAKARVPLIKLVSSRAI